MTGYDKSGSDNMTGKLTSTHSFAFVPTSFGFVDVFHCMRLAAAGVLCRTLCSII
jgi:hypothetical protein